MPIFSVYIWSQHLTYILKPYHPLQYKQHVHSHSFVLLWQTLYQIDKTPPNCFRQLIIQYPQMSSDIQLLFVFCFFLSCVSFLIILATYCWYNFIKLSLLFLLNTDREAMSSSMHYPSTPWMQNHSIYLLSNFHHMFAIPWLQNRFYTSYNEYGLFMAYLHGRCRVKHTSNHKK